MIFDGKVLETPGEPGDSQLKERVRHPAYPALEQGGLIFTYLGPKPVPLFPRFHFLVAEGEREILIQSFNDSNWLQNVENGIDPFHVTFLHSDVWTPMAAEPQKVAFEENEWGVVYKALRPGRKAGEYNYREHAIIMPAISSGGDTTVSAGEDGIQGLKLPIVTCRWSVPVDDTHTVNLRYRFKPGGTGETKYLGVSASAVPIEPYKEYRDSDDPVLGYHMRSTIHEEDATVLDSLGPVSDRENENLSVIDGGVTSLRDLYLRQIEAVRAGKDPIGVVRGQGRERAHRHWDQLPVGLEKKSRWGR